MNLYECPECHVMYSKADLIRTKCSENEVGSYMIDYCPKCMNKRKPKMVKLFEREATNTEAILLGYEDEEKLYTSQEVYDWLEEQKIGLTLDEDTECINWLEQEWMNKEN